MVGAGQLARMTHQAAVALGQSLRVLAAAPDEPAALVSGEVVIGSYEDLGVMRAFARRCDVLTFDHEHVPLPVLRALRDDGVPVYPSPEALLYAKDKLAMRTRLAELGLPVPPFAAVRTAADVVGFGAAHGWPCVLKAVRGGYDGRGVWMLNTPTGARRVAGELLAAGRPLMVEQCVPMRAELAALVARSPYGQGAAWPVVQTVQREGVCVQVLAPAPQVPPRRALAAQELALRIAAELDVVGVLAVELFDTPSGLVVNELAMRPHNSGHWTIEGAHTSQFEQHLRAVLDYPLGSTALVAAGAVMANVLGASTTPAMSLDERLHHVLARYPGAHVHLYGKAERPGRKLGHVTVLANPPATTMAAAKANASQAAHQLATGTAPHPTPGVSRPPTPGVSSPHVVVSSLPVVVSSVSAPPDASGEQQ
jgi:5-(carboxyamino)imidazole ribonucleotide synthase